MSDKNTIDANKISTREFDEPPYSSSSFSISSMSSISSSSVSSESSSLSSLSSESSPSSPSSSSPSSNYGFLETPWDVTLTNANPVTRKISLTWKWTTQDHWGAWVNPTGFIVERQIGTDEFTTLTYSILPNDPPSVEDYFYEDTLSEKDSARVFALGYQITYRIRVYWLTP